MHGFLRLGGVAASLAALAVASGALAQSKAPADPLANLARDVAAVISPGPEGRILVTEEEHGTSNTRTLGVGDEYRAGWKIDSIAERAVGLRKGSETRTVTLRGRTEQARAEAPPASITLPLTMAAPRPPAQRGPGRGLADVEDLMAQSNAILASMTPEQRAELNEQMARAAAQFGNGMPRSIEEAQVLLQQSPGDIQALMNMMGGQGGRGR